MQRYSVAAITAALLLAGSDTAFAHAMLTHAEPGVGATVAAAPHAVELSFTEGVVPKFCGVTIRDAAGKPVHTGKPAAGGAATQLVVPIAQNLPNGTYTVTWHAVSVDTHRTEGHFSFTVAP